jgi:hypothetical protein
MLNRWYILLPLSFQWCKACVCHCSVPEAKTNDPDHMHKMSLHFLTLSIKLARQLQLSAWPLQGAMRKPLGLAAGCLCNHGYVTQAWGWKSMNFLPSQVHPTCRLIKDAGGEMQADNWKNVGPKLNGNSCWHFTCVRLNSCWHLTCAVRHELTSLILLCTFR